MIWAGLFECYSGVRFETIDDWLDELVWYRMILAFPVLLVAVLVVMGTPFIVIGLAGELINL